MEQYTQELHRTGEREGDGEEEKGEREGGVEAEAEEEGSKTGHCLRSRIQPQLLTREGEQSEGGGRGKGGEVDRHNQQSRTPKQQKGEIHIPDTLENI